jgi:2-methylcitrate dehydratase PrpD
MTGAVVTGARTLSEQIAEYVHGLRFEDLPPAVVERSKHHLLHHLGLALTAGSTPDGEQAVRIAGMLSAGTGACTVIGSGQRVAPLDAAFANSTLMRAGGLDDVLFPVGVHAGLVTMPVGLALAEQAGLSGRDWITAVVAGYDVIGKLGRPVWAWSSDTPRRPTIAYGPFGAATVAAKLLGLDPATTAHAVGYAAHSAMGLAEGALVTHYYGLVARNGLLGALLAREGGTAAPTTLDGRFGFFNTFFGHLPPGLEDSLSTFGTTFEIENATIKRYPGTALNIVPIELTAGLTRAHQLRPDQVSTIEVTLPQERANFAEGHSTGPFSTRAAATSSVAFQIAIVLLDGGVDLARYDRVDSPDIRELLAKMRVTLVPDREIRYARIRITTYDGRDLVAEGNHYEFPRTEWLPALVDQAGTVVSEDRLARIVELVSRLDQLKDISDLTHYLAAP